MKKLPSLLVANLIFFGFSCQEQLDPRVSARLNSHLPYLSFDSDDKFEAVTNMVAAMTDEELDVWEQEQGFLSYRSVFRQAMQEWQNVESPADLSKFLAKYDDIVTVVDSVLRPHIDIRLYQGIVNREGVYETNGFLHKIVGDEIMTVAKADAEKLNSISHNAELTPKESGVRAYRYRSRPVEKEARVNSTCTTHMTASYFHNESNCRHDRRVYMSARSYVVLSTNTTGDYRQPRVEIKVWGTLRTGTWCNWKQYSTTLAYRNVSFSIMAWADQGGIAIPQSYSRVLPDYAPAEDRWDLPWDQPIGDRVHNQVIYPSPFTNFHGEATSRGAHGVWVILDCL
jgi:hypothetical protein